MGFSTLTFIFLFFPFLLLFAFINLGLKSTLFSNIFLLIFSILFYCVSGFETVPVVIGLILFVWLMGKLCSKRFADGFIVLSVVLLVLLLFLYKYLSWIIELIGTEPVFPALAAPLGVSFLIFSAISYVIDIYRGAPAGNLFECALFLLFFPKILSGPIVLWKNFQPQIKSRSISWENMNAGLCRISIGLAKKVILADTFGNYIIQINEKILEGQAGDTQTFWLIAILYFFQIYFDFSGYSDSAIGLCQIFGFYILENFRYPYVSKSVSEFWRRWHISLGTWFREYVYIPLGGSRTGNVYINLFIVFLLTGIWHGANWTYILWGVLNGCMVVIERFLNKCGILQRVPSWICWCFTMIFIFFSWILFMAPDIPSAGSQITAMFTYQSADFYSWHYWYSRKILFLLLIAAIASAAGASSFVQIRIVPFLYNKFGIILKDLFCLGLLVISVVYIVNSSYTPNIYFQF